MWGLGMVLVKMDRFSCVHAIRNYLEKKGKSIEKVDSIAGAMSFSR